MPNRIVPLSPSLAIRIVPNIAVDRGQADLSFRHFQYKRRKVSWKDVVEVNRLIVRSAEECVFLRDNLPWTTDFVRKNSGFRIEFRESRLHGGMMLSGQQIVEIREDPAS